jgi:DNA-binding NarL/FixJ family response regulator
MTSSSDRTPATVVVLDRFRVTRPHRRQGTSPAIRVLLAEDRSPAGGRVRALRTERAPIAVVAEATTGENAVALARRTHPDVMLLDADLAGLDCVEATRRIVAESAVAVLLLTRREDDERVFAALRAGAKGVLSGNTEPSGLLHAVEVLARGDTVLSPGVTRRLIAKFAAEPEPDPPLSALFARPCPGVAAPDPLPLAIA